MMHSPMSQSPMTLDVPPPSEWMARETHPATFRSSSILIEDSKASSSDRNGLKDSSYENALVDEFSNSIVISEPTFGESAGSKCFNNEPKALSFKKRPLASRRGIPRPLDLNLQSSEHNIVENNTVLQAPRPEAQLPPVTPLDQIIPNPIMPPPAPKPRQGTPLTIQSRRLSSTSVNARISPPGLFISPTKPTNYMMPMAKQSFTTSSLDVAVFLTTPGAPSGPLLSPIRLVPDYPVYRPESSPMDSDFDLYGAMPTPKDLSPAR
ncbi:hypothetical protein M408DRAFT_321924 [Serendipita vermifera MAFF 305830]|uniref:Uncharacterized protein n=1 Tax=Serendipita vermifera MAFF 305830 TaxID=933852 RepID=A0A0C3BHH1_SERVB|nr:hypothetical protein M408DRAFT_321924 [Serendipita vermifera MAFF 305830]